jgi:hypothetical protein
MSAPVDLRRRVEVLEAAAAIEDAPSGIVIYQPGETEEETRARAPPGVGTVVFLPDNGRDRSAAPT